MNKTFKTLWNDVRRCYIVANEAQKTHGKPSKAAVVAVAVAAAMGQRLLPLRMLNLVL